MKYEFHAQFSLALRDSATQAFAISVLVGKREKHPSWKEIYQLQNTFEGINILAQSIITPYKELARMGTRLKADGYRYWIEYKANDFLKNQLNFVNDIGLRHSLPDLLQFPPGSWTVQITFTLRKPYLSKDDVDFYIIDNPVKKEWVFKVPYVAPSQWKGALRAAIMRELVEEQLEPEEFAKRRYRLVLLFGDEKGEEPGSIKGLAGYLDQMGGEEAAQLFRKMVRSHFGIPDDKPMPHLRGSLHFYPTFFGRIGLEAINPHPRDTGAGKNPIYFECVPAGTSGIFTLLYVPLDTGPKDEQSVQADLEAVASGVRAMLTTYGFGAKTSSGYGVADVLKNQSQIVPPDLEKVFWKAWEEK